MNTDDKPQKNKLEQWDNLFNYIGVLLNLLMAFPFLSFWISPHNSDIERIYTAAVLIGFEFIMVHSGVFMAVVPAKISLFIFFPFYGLFALAFNKIVHDNLILYNYLIVVFNRLRYAFFNVSKEVRAKLILRSALAAFSYFVLIVVGALCASSIPTLGLSPNFLQQSNYYNHIKLHGGLLLNKPHVPIFIGTAYYILLAIIEYIIISKKSKIIV